MKKKAKKLVLAKETLTRLQNGLVMGGATAAGACISGTGCGAPVCPYSDGYHTCVTCDRNTCGTNLC